MVATMPERCASRTMSVVLKRERGKPRVTGNSQAMAFTCTTTSGGKNPGAARARSFLQASQAFVEEAFAPKADHVASHGERGSDLVIGAALSGQKNHLGSEHRKIWQCIFAGARLQDLSLHLGQVDSIWA